MAYNLSRLGLFKKTVYSLSQYFGAISTSIIINIAPKYLHIHNTHIFIFIYVNNILYCNCTDKITIDVL